MPTVRAQPPGDVTVLLKRFKDGDSEAGDQLIELVSYELRRLAGSYLRNERRGHSIQPTELVNEAVLRLMGLDRIDWQHRSHFFRVAARKMREILIDHARKHLAQKRGGGITVVTYIDERVVATVPAAELVALNDALDSLAKEPCCTDRDGNGILPFPSRSVRRCVRTQAVRARSLCSGLFGRVGSP